MRHSSLMDQSLKDDWGKEEQEKQVLHSDQPNEANEIMNRGMSQGQLYSWSCYQGRRFYFLN